MILRSKTTVLALAAMLTLVLGITATTQAQTADKTITISLPHEPITVDEGNGIVTIPVTFNLTGSQDTASGAYVIYSSQGHGDSPATKNQDWQDDPDLILADNEVNLNSLTTSNPVVVVPINLPIIDDSDIESDGETFTVRIRDPRLNNPTIDADAVIELGISEVVITITDNDADTTPPAITVPPDITMDATGPLTIVNLGDVTVSNDQDEGDLRVSANFRSLPPGTVTITWTATDSAGNTATDTQTVTIQDTPPVITLNGTTPTHAIRNSLYTDAGATCFDNVDGVISVTVGGDTIDTATSGSYTITYDCQDSAGNTAIQATRIVQVAYGDGTVMKTVEINDGTANGPVLGNDDIFGTSVANIGDLDGDGIQDIAAGAYSNPTLYSANNKGAVHIMFMNSNGTVRETVEINGNTTNGPTLSDLSRLGLSIANIGDLDGDGVVDLAAGADVSSITTGSATESFKGAVHIMFMNSNGTVRETVEINEDTVNGPILRDNARFGGSVTDIGDLDGDGILDIAAGAFYNSNRRSDAGAVHIMFMNSNGTVRETAAINSSTPNGPVLGNIYRFGTSVANIGDLNDDGVTDIAAGAYGDDSSGSDEGAVHIMFMNSNGTVKETVRINGDTPNGPTLNNFDLFGTSVANIGDIDGDGILDIAAGALLDDNGGTNRGAVHIMFMNTDGTPKRTVEINSSTANGPTLNDGDLFSRSIANMGDIDGNGIQDIIVGAHLDDNGGTNRGTIHIMFMR